MTCSVVKKAEADILEKSIKDMNLLEFTIFLSAFPKEIFTTQDLVDALAKYKGTTLEKKTVSNQTPEGYYTFTNFINQVKKTFIKNLGHLCLNLKEDRVQTQGENHYYQIPNLADTLNKLLSNYESILFGSQIPFSPPPIPRDSNNNIAFNNLWGNHPLAVLYIAYKASKLCSNDEGFTTDDLVQIIYGYIGKENNEKSPKQKTRKEKAIEKTIEKTFLNHLKKLGLETSSIEGSKDKKAPTYIIQGLKEKYEELSGQCQPLIETLQANLTLRSQDIKRKADEMSGENTDDSILKRWKSAKQSERTQDKNLIIDYHGFGILNNNNADPSLEEMPSGLSNFIIHWRKGPQ